MNESIKTVVVGGGHGLSTLLRGLKKKTSALTAIVTVADDGGSSGMLRQELAMPAPGDIRNCIQALANIEPTMEKLMEYRFDAGSLKGHSFGNLFIAALNGVFPSFDEAVAKMGEVLAITGKVLPVTNDSVNLVADFDNGESVFGESKIAYYKKQRDLRIEKVSLIPKSPAALPASLIAISEAQLIVFGPGSLYTSVIPNLLVEGICGAIKSSDALKLYVCNVMTQDGETEGYTVGDHIEALFAHSYEGLFEYCIANDAEIPTRLKGKYAKEGAEPAVIDRKNIERLGVKLISCPLSTEKEGLARHDSDALAEAIFRVYKSVRGGN